MSSPITIKKGVAAHALWAIDAAHQEAGWVIITDHTVAALPYFKKVTATLKNLTHTFVLPLGEETKSWPAIEDIVALLMQKQISRRSAIVALGGGVIGDLAGFLASIYHRGVAFYTMPTTLLAQVDAAMGGKNAINSHGVKNVLGTFYHPKWIVIDPIFLESVPDAHFRSGLAEVVKYGLIQDASFFEWLEVHCDKLLARDPAALLYAIGRSVQFKMHIVNQDEKEENGLRAILNFGHTLGHAIEAVTHFEWHHGEAVSVGMVHAARLSEAKGWLSSESCERIERLLKKMGLPVECAHLDQADLERAIKQDKKNTRQHTHWILLKKIGEAVAKP